MADREAKGRNGLSGRSGEHNSQARLTVDQVRDIRRRVANGEPHRQVAPIFGVTHQTVGKIARRQKWGAIPD